MAQNIKFPTDQSITGRIGQVPRVLDKFDSTALLSQHPLSDTFCLPTSRNYSPLQFAKMHNQLSRFQGNLSMLLSEVARSGKNEQIRVERLSFPAAHFADIHGKMSHNPHYPALTTQKARWST
eukprot:2006696-Pleurochrysis_carterae.AAC.4